MPSCRPNWKIGQQANFGGSDEYSRNKSAVQKDWAIFSAHQLTSTFCIAVKGSKGWDPLVKAKYALVVSFEAVDQDVEIYTPIRTLVEVETEIANEVEIEIDEGEN